MPPDKPSMPDAPGGLPAIHRDLKWEKTMSDIDIEDRRIKHEMIDDVMELNKALSAMATLILGCREDIELKSHDIDGIGLILRKISNEIFEIF